MLKLQTKKQEAKLEVKIESQFSEMNLIHNKDILVKQEYKQTLLQFQNVTEQINKMQNEIAEFEKTLKNEKSPFSDKILQKR